MSNDKYKDDENFELDVDSNYYTNNIDANTKVAQALGIAPAPALPMAIPKPRIARPNASTSMVENDADYARTNIYEIIEQGAQAIQDAQNLARESLHPRSFEVLGQLLKIQSDNVDKLLKLHNDKMKLNANSAPVSTGDTVNNTIIFNGTSDELIRAIRKQTRALDAIDADVIEEQKEE